MRTVAGQPRLGGHRDGALYLHIRVFFIYFVTTIYYVIAGRLRADSPQPGALYFCLFDKPAALLPASADALVIYVADRSAPRPAPHAPRPVPYEPCPAPRAPRRAARHVRASATDRYPRITTPRPDTRNNHVVRCLTPSAVSTLAGRPGTPGLRNGSLCDALLASPSGLALDTDGRLLVAGEPQQQR